MEFLQAGLLMFKNNWQLSQLEKWLTSSLVTFMVLDTGPVAKSYIVISVF
jgi:hypothetical protein